MEETLDAAGKHVAAAAETAGQALGQAFSWISTTTKSTVDTVRDKYWGFCYRGLNKVRSSQTASAGADVTSGWSSLVGSASSLWSKAQNAMANEGGMRHGERSGRLLLQRPHGQMQKRRIDDQNRWLAVAPAKTHHRRHKQEQLHRRAMAVETLEVTMLLQQQRGGTGEPCPPETF